MNIDKKEIAKDLKELEGILAKARKSLKKSEALKLEDKVRFLCDFADISRDIYDMGDEINSSQLRWFVMCGNFRSILRGTYYLLKELDQKPDEPLKDAIEKVRKAAQLVEELIQKYT